MSLSGFVSRLCFVGLVCFSGLHAQTQDQVVDPPQTDVAQDTDAAQREPLDRAIGNREHQPKRHEPGYHGNHGPIRNTHALPAARAAGRHEWTEERLA